MTIDESNSEIHRFTNLHILLVLTIVIYLFCFAINSLTRVRDFSELDPMNFVDVARNMANGHGVVQSTVGFNVCCLSMHDEFPQPMTSQPPGFPFFIMLLSSIGISYANSALILSVMSYGALLICVYGLCALLFDRRTALFTIVVLLLYDPLSSMAMTAMSDVFGTVPIFAALWLVVYIRHHENSPVWLSFIAGLLVGGAFATRYGSVPLFVIVALILVKFTNLRGTIRQLILMSFGCLLLVAPIVINNILVTGSVLGAGRNPATDRLIDIILTTRGALTGTYLPFLSPHIQTRLLVVVILLLVMRLIWQGKPVYALKNLVYNHQRWVVPLWAFAYLSLLIYSRSQFFFDEIDIRLILPAGIAFTILFAALIVETIPIKEAHLLYIAILISIILIGFQLYIIWQQPPIQDSDRIAESAYLTWVADHVSARDLVVGDDTVYIPFYFEHPAAISFSPYPYTNYPEYETIQALSCAKPDEYENVFLIVRDRYDQESDWLEDFGQFITDIIYGRTARYPGVSLLESLEDSYIFQMDCRAST